MNISKLMIVLFSLLFLLFSCTREVSLEEKSVTVKDEEVESWEGEKRDEETLENKENSVEGEELQAFYKGVIEETFSILDSSSVGTVNGTSLEETIVQVDEKNVIGIYQSADDSVSYVGYRFDENKNGYVLYDGSMYSGELYIPCDIDGLEVVEIAEGAFRGNTKLTGALYLPSGIRVIGNYAFENCTGLSGSLVLPTLLEKIGKYAFSGVTLSGDIILPSGLTSLEEGAFSSSLFDGYLYIGNELETIGDNAFSNTPVTGDLVIPEGVRRIGSHAFDSCAFDGALILGEGIESISDYAFANNALLHFDIYFPSSLKTLSYNAFDGCISLNGSYFVNESGYVLVN